MKIIEIFLDIIKKISFDDPAPKPDIVLGNNKIEDAKTNRVVVNIGNKLPRYFDKYPKTEPKSGKKIAAYSI